jgi:hypothetical protein
MLNVESQAGDLHEPLNIRTNSPVKDRVYFADI